MNDIYNWPACLHRLIKAVYDMLVRECRALIWILSREMSGMTDDWTPPPKLRTVSVGGTLIGPPPHRRPRLRVVSIRPPDSACRSGWRPLPRCAGPCGSPCAAQGCRTLRECPGGPHRTSYVSSCLCCLSLVTVAAAVCGRWPLVTGVEWAAQRGREGRAPGGYYLGFSP